MSNVRIGAVAGLALLVVLIVLGWLLRPEPSAAPVGPSPGAVAPTPRQASAAPTSVPRPVAPEPREGVGEEPVVGARTRMVERLAAERDQLHVRCYVGEEFSAVNGVDGGWFSRNVDEREGMAIVGDVVFGAQLVVRWSAPEDATQTACVPEAPRWAYVTVHVEEEAGGPAAGVAVTGCGALGETGDDGVAELPVMVTGEPCTLDVFRWDAERQVHSQAFARTAPLAENDERVLRIPLVDVEAIDGASPRFDLAAVHASDDVDVVGVPELLPEPTPADRLEDYEERAESMRASLQDLKAVWANTPEDERWVVEEELERTRAWLADVEEEVEALAAEVP